MTGSDTARRAGPNPFVGPRPLKRGETLYGRERELRELYYLLSAERIVVLHSPSGAGKSSLVHAGLLGYAPVRERFDVWRPTRLNQEPPASRANGVNRYVFSALLGFEEGIPDKLRHPPEELERQTLAEYVKGRPRRPSASESVFLVFDQFEEILTVDPLARETKREFFDQLGELLHDPQIWALFALREDYLAPLDPFASQVPTHLQNRFRIDLLNLEGAREAMVQPARTGHRDFLAVDKLVHDLATTNVQQPDGSFQEVDGDYVEPVQLQVVCRRLWDEMPPAQLTIGVDDLKKFGDVNKALGAYYDQAVGRAAGDSFGGIRRERKIREWFRDKLLTADGIRSQVRKGEAEAGGLSNEVIGELLNAHLVRGEKRASATWYELAHDRLVGPVRSSNGAWFEADLKALGFDYPSAVKEIADDPAGSNAREREVREWFHEKLITESGGRDKVRKGETASEGLDNELIDELLATHLIRAEVIAGATWFELADERLVEPVRSSNEAWFDEKLQPFQREANSWSKENQRPGLLVEGDELHAAQRWAAEHPAELTEVEKDFLSKSLESQKALQREQRYNRVSRWAAVFFLALAAGSLALARWAFDERQAARAQAARAQALQAASEPEHIDSALLAALEASKVEDSFESRTALLSLQGAAPRLISVLARQGGMVQSVAFDPDGRLLAAGGDGRSVLLINLEKKTQLTKIVGQIHVVSFSPDGRRLAVAGDGTGEIHLLDSEGLEERGKFEERDADHQDAVRALIFHPDEPFLFSGGDKGLRVWRVPESDEVFSGEAEDVIDDVGVINSLAFDAAGGKLYSAGAAGVVSIWDLGTDGRLTRTGALPGAPLAPLNDIAFNPSQNPNGGAIAAVSNDGRAWLWRDPTNGPRLVFEGQGPRRNLETVAFAPNGKLLAISGEDGNIRTWSVADLEAGPTIDAHPDKVRRIEFSGDGTQLATVGLDRTVRLFHLEKRFHRETNDERERVDLPGEGRPGFALSGHEGLIEAVAFSPDNAFTASGSRDGRLALWDVAAGEREFLAKEHEREISAIAFAPDNQRFVSGDRGGRINIWDVYKKRVGSFEIADRSDDRKSSRFWIWGIAFNPTNGDELAIARNGGAVEVWEQDSEKNWVRRGFPRILHENERVRTVAYRSDGTLLASGGGDGNVVLWNPNEPNGILRTVTPGRQQGADPSAPSPGMMRVVFSPDGTTLFASTDDGRIHRWALEGSESGGGLPEARPLLPPLEGHQDGDEARCLAIDPEGKFLASGSSDQTVWLWDLARGEAVYRLLGHGDQVQEVAFDGKFLVSGSADETVRFWGFYGFDSAASGAGTFADLETIQRRACEVANRGEHCPVDWQYTKPARP